MIVSKDIPVNSPARKVSNHGFTIIELLIATVVFSVILLVLAGAIIQIGRIYMKGLNNAHTQQVARNLVNGITTAIQLTPGNIGDASASNVDAKCIGVQRYSYILGQQVASGQHAVVFDTSADGSCSSPLDITQPLPTGSTEILGQGMRLAYLEAAPQDMMGQRWAVDARVIYGDDDLLCDNVHVNCSDGATVMTQNDIASAGQKLRCKDIHAGSQFCSVSEIATTVERRVTP